MKHYLFLATLVVSTAALVITQPFKECVIPAKAEAKQETKCCCKDECKCCCCCLCGGQCTTK